MTNKGILTAVAAAAFFMIALGAAAPVSAAQAKHLSQKEVKELIANAKEPQDHLRLASYYSSEADQLEATASEHEAMAEVYRKTQGIKNLAAPTQTVGHCEYFVKSMREAA